MDPVAIKPVFTDKKRPPTDADLVSSLGAAKRHWDALLAHIAKSLPDSQPGWKHYAGASGWQLVVRSQARNFAYFKPLSKSFLLALALNETACKAAGSAKLPADLLESIRNAPASPEGCAARLIIASAADASTGKSLITVKASS